MTTNSTNIEHSVTGQQLDSDQGDPKNKSEEKKEKVLNRQDDNSYDEQGESKPSGTKDSTEKQDGTNKNFEYSDSGEFENDSFVKDANPNDEYL